MKKHLTDNQLKTGIVAMQAKLHRTQKRERRAYLVEMIQDYRVQLVRRERARIQADVKGILEG